MTLLPTTSKASRRSRRYPSLRPAFDACVSHLPHSHRDEHKAPSYRPSPASLQSAPSEMLSGLLLEDAILYNATRKVNNPPDKVFFNGILAGFWVGLGGLAAVSAAGGIPEDVRHHWLSLPKFLMGTFFAFALHFIALFGGDLFTGNTMVLAVGWYNGVIPLRRMLLNWFLVYLGNWAGCLLTAYFLGYLTNSFDYPQYRSYLNEVVVSKLEHLTWAQIFLRAIPANTMVCMAVMLGLSARDAAGKIMALWFPVVMFVLCSYEHCVANMFFTSLGLMYGAESSISRQWYNQSAAVLGNIIGGAIFIGLIEHLLNHWKSPIFRSHHPMCGTFVGHDVESTRRARDVEEYACVGRKPAPEANAEEPVEARRTNDDAINPRLPEEKPEPNGQVTMQPGGSATTENEHEGRSLWRALVRGGDGKKDAAYNV